MGVDINFDDSVDNEYICLKIMQEFGLPTCNADIEIFEDQKGNIWVATNGGGVILLDPVKRNHKRFLNDKDDPVSCG